MDNHILCPGHVSVETQNTQITIYPYGSVPENGGIWSGCTRWNNITHSIINNNVARDSDDCYEDR